METEEDRASASAQYRKRFSQLVKMTFSFERDKLTLVEKQKIEKTLFQPTVAKPEEGKHTGFWYELRDFNGRTLYYNVSDSPFIRFTEPDPERPVISAESYQPIRAKGSFNIMIPDIPEGHEVIIFSSPMNSEKMNKPAKELARFTIKIKEAK